MIGSPPGPALATRRSALALTALALLVACAAGTEPSERRVAAGAGAGPVLALATGRSVLPVVDVELFELGPALLPAPRADWTREAVERVGPVLETLARERRMVLVQPPGEQEGERARALAALRDAVLAVSAQALGGRFALRPFGAIPEQAALPPLGRAAAALARATGAEHALFLFLRESRATRTLRDTNRWRAGVAAASGLSTTLFFGVATARVVLVDLTAGRIVAARGFVSGDPGPSLLDPAGAEAVLRAVLTDSGT